MSCTHATTAVQVTNNEGRAQQLRLQSDDLEESLQRETLEKSVNIVMFMQSASLDAVRPRLLRCSCARVLCTCLCQCNARERWPVH